MAGKSGPSNRLQAYGKAVTYVGLGVELVVPVLLCLFVGQWLDAKLDTTPVLMLIGALLGAAAGFTGFIRTVLKLQRGNRRGQKADQDKGVE